MLNLATAMVLILISWGILAAMLVGLGLAIQSLACRGHCLLPPPLWGRSACNHAGWGVSSEAPNINFPAKPLGPRRAIDGDRVWTAFWLGFALVIGLLQIWHLFLPVQWPTLAILFLAAAMGLLTSRKELASWLRSIITGHPGLCAIAFLVAVWLANRALGPPVGDSGGYHLAVIRWLTTYPIVPGLACLQERFAFNNASLLWPALLETGFWYGRSSHLANGLLLLAMALRILWAGATCLRAHAKPDAEMVFTALLMTPIVASAVTLQELRLSSPDPDTTAALVLLAGATGLARLLAGASPTRQQRWNDFIFCTAMFILAFCIKTSTLGFVIPTLGLTLLWACRGAEDRRLSPRASLPCLLGMAAFFLVPWVIRGIILSGYPLFPAPWLGFPVDWRLPAATEITFKAIRQNFMPPVAWQMVKAGRSQPAAWLIWQITRCPELVIFPTILCLVGAALYWRAKARQVADCQLLWLLVPSLGGVLLWLATAPAPRFAYPFLWTAAAALLATAYLAYLEPDTSRSVAPAAFHKDHRLLFTLLWLAIGFMPVAHRVAAWTAAGNPDNALATLWLGPGPDHGLDPTPPAKLHKLQTESGLTVYFPDDANMLWDGPLPGTTDFIPGLALRRPPDMAGGFRIEPSKR